MGPSIRVRRTALAVAALCLAGSTDAAAGPASPRIVGGQPATNPGWIAVLTTQFSVGGGMCGGSLIARDWVLTAAHCVTDEVTGQAVAPGDVRVWVGLDRLSQRTASNASTVDRIEVNPVFFTRPLHGDVAALRLAAQVPRDPVALGPEPDPVIGSVPIVLGWGLTRNRSDAEPNPPPSETLQQTEAPVLAPSRCAFYGALFEESSMICAGATPGRDSCGGDSGGPLAFASATPAAELVGTVGYGSDVCGDGTPAVYQRLTAGPVASWLAETAPQVQLSLSSTTPHHDTAVTAAASATKVGSPTYSWDFNGDGQFTEAAGSQVQVPVGIDPVGVAVRATGPDGQVVARRATIVPLYATVHVTAPAAVSEGQAIVLALTRVGNGAGRVTAALSGAGLRSHAVGVDVPPATSISVPVDGDRTWQPPRTARILLAADGDLDLKSPPELHVGVLDDDRPVLRIRRVRQRSPRTLQVTLSTPGAGTVALRMYGRGRRVATRRFKATSAAARTVRVTLSRSARRTLLRRRPVVRASWQSSVQRSARASASRTGPRLK